jgi:hypothetical protein
VDNFNRDIFKNIYLTLIAAGEDSYLYSGKMPLMIDKQNAIQTFLKIDLIFYTNNKISKCYVSIYQEKTE